VDHNLERRLHQDLDLLGLRAPATAAGLLQLTAELFRAGVIDKAAANRVKDAIACDLIVSRPRITGKDEYATIIRQRLDALFDARC
jgi:hypothetical protein